jgi:hypothetical protein
MENQSQSPRLSEHILLGDSLRTRDAGRWYDPQENCGCALGGAMLSLGHGAKTLSSADIVAQWPWLSKEDFAVPGRVNYPGIVMISALFLELCNGRYHHPDQPKTIEQLADQVRQWEDEFDDNLKSQSAASALSTIVAPAQKEEVPCLQV